MEGVVLQSNELLIALLMSIAVAVLGFPAIILSIVLLKNRQKQNEDK
ncbi:MAG: hypothetical protein BWY19_00646 [bacterium ADurb.Bin212]|nr:MAG: hypothetical protein BWY19_00646 [bacterium ADurb.Bin212]